MDVNALLTTLRTQVDTFTAPLNNPYIYNVIQLLVILYGALAAPELPLSVSKHFSNTWVRAGFMLLVLAIGTRKPSLAALVTIVYMISLHFMTKKALVEVAKFGVVTPETSIVISGGSGPSIKPQVVVVAEHEQMNKSVQEGAFNVPQGIISAIQGYFSNAAPIKQTQRKNEQGQDLPHYDIEPEAVLDTFPAAPFASMPNGLPQIASGVPMSETGMTAPMPEESVPVPYESTAQETLSQTPL